MISQKDRYFINRLSYHLELKQKKDGLWNCKCPIQGCDDKNRKKRFFMVDKGSYVLCYCHNCGYSTSLRTFIKNRFPSMLDDYIMFGFVKKKSLAEKAEKAIASVPEKEIPTYVEKDKLHRLTIDPNLLSDKHPAKKYIIHRQIPFKLVRYCKDFYQLSKELHQDDTFKKYAIPAMLIPFYRLDSKIEIIQARFFDPKVKPKYITIKLNEDALKIYNKDFIDEDETVWIVEGPIDSMFVPNAVAMGGSDGEGIWSRQVWVLDNEPDNEIINKKLQAKIQDGEKVVVWKPSDDFKDINEGIVRGLFTKDDVPRMLRERTFSGLKARLEFAKFRK